MREKLEDKLELLRAAIQAEVDAGAAGRSTLEIDKLLEQPWGTFAEVVNAAEPKLGTPDENGVMKPDAGLAPRLRLHEQLLGLALKRLDELKKRHDDAIPDLVVYTPGAYDESKKVHKIYGAQRRRLDKRMPKTETGRDIRDKVGIGATVPENAPGMVAKFSSKMLEVLGDKTHEGIFEAAGLEPLLMIRKLRAPAKRLDDELKKGPTQERRGELSPEVAKGLAFVDVVLQRLGGFLEDHGCETEADILAGRLPRKFQRRASDVKGKGKEESKTEEKTKTEEKKTEEPSEGGDP